jgi:rhombotail lipoprotein
MTTRNSAWPRLASILLLAAPLSGCTALDRLMCTPNCGSQTRASSSLVDFLYPEDASPPAANSIPELRVPLRVGLAFLPEAGQARGLPAARQQELLERMRERFRTRKFVQEIVIIPEYYLTNARGFAGLEGVQRLYNVDVMALVSYDQITHFDDNRLSLGYLTIVGAYVLKGSRYDATTLVDLAVVDPATRSLVLRAGGVDSRRANTTLVDQQVEARGAALDSLDAATDQLMVHLDQALTQFEADVRAGKANVRVAKREGASHSSGGGGSLDLLAIVGLLGIGMVKAGGPTRDRRRQMRAAAR